MKSYVIFLIAIVFVVVSAQGARAQGSFVGVKSAVAKKCGCDWIITIEGNTSLDKDDIEAKTLTVTITDPNNNAVKIDSLTWTKPKPGENTAFTAVSVAVSVSGEYSFKATYTYTKSNKTPGVSVNSGTLSAQ